MNNKMAMSTYLSTIESKIKNREAVHKQNDRYIECLDGFQMGGGLGSGGGCKVQHKQQRSWRTYMQDPRIWTMMLTLSEGGEGQVEEIKGKNLGQV